VASAATPGALRPRAVSELLDDSFRLYRRHFTLLATVSFLVAIPSLVIGIAVALSTANLQRLTTTVGTSTGPSSVDVQTFFQQFIAQLIPLFILGGLLLLLAGPLIFGANINAAVDVIAGRPATPTSVLGGTLRRYFALLGLIGVGALFLIGLWAVAGVSIVLTAVTRQPILAVLGVVAAIALGIWLGIRWALVLPAMFAEHLGPIKGLSRSYQLVRGEWWRTLGILLLLQIMIGIISFALGAIFTPLFGVLPGLSLEVRDSLSQVASTLVQAIIEPVPALAIALLYFDMRVRKEGYDLDELARQAAQGPPTV
jgi:hypothetical protein